jgi:hypothetical protein
MFQQILLHLLATRLPVPIMVILCVPDNELIPAMQGSPFYKSFSGLPPFSSDHSSPPSSHEYNSDYSFDSVAEYNIQNMLEA